MFLPLLKYLCSERRHAVDAPVRLPVLVANGDGEPAEVGSDDADHAVQAGAITVLTSDGHVLGFTPVVRLVQCSIRTSPWNERRETWNSMWEKNLQLQNGLFDEEISDIWKSQNLIWAFSLWYSVSQMLSIKAEFFPMFVGKKEKKKCNFLLKKKEGKWFKMIEFFYFFFHCEWILLFNQIRLPYWNLFHRKNKVEWILHLKDFF